MHHAGDDDGGEDGAPARLHYHHTQDLPLLLLNVNLPGNKPNFVVRDSAESQKRKQQLRHHFGPFLYRLSSCWINYGNVSTFTVKILIVKTSLGERTQSKQHA